MCRRAEGDAAAAGVSGKPETGAAAGMSGKPETGAAAGMSGKPETSAGPETEFPARTLYGRLKVLEEPGAPLEPEQRLKAMNRPLLAWYETHARVLPWREDPQPYRVWISEIMLQQTRVEAVKPYFERFLKELPDVAALARVEDDRLMKLWEGLGYYNRARNLKKAAAVVAENYGGRMPSDYGTLLKLPGIGTYTAGAIASIAFGQPVPAVDGNVLRVISRVLASWEDILKQSTKRWMEALLAKTMPQDQASHFNQGLIEIGAVVCVPAGSPRCGECPLESLCLAKREGLTGEIPVKTPAKKRRREERTVCILEQGSRVGIRKRGSSGLLADLYELPNVEGYLEAEALASSFGLEPGNILQVEPLPEARHIFSHVEWHMKGYRVLFAGEFPREYMAVEKGDLQTVYPLPNAFAAYRKLIR